MLVELTFGFLVWVAGFLLIIISGVIFSPLTVHDLRHVPEVYYDRMQRYRQGRPVEIKVFNAGNKWNTGLQNRIFSDKP